MCTDEYNAMIREQFDRFEMPLLYTPYVPSLGEDFILRNRRILADQMEFLMAHVPRTSRLLV